MNDRDVINERKNPDPVMRSGHVQDDLRNGYTVWRVVVR